MIKFMLVVIFMAGDGSGYKDYVGAFDTMAECETIRKTLLKQGLQSYPKDAVVFSACAPARPLHGIDV